MSCFDFFATTLCVSLAYLVVIIRRLYFHPLRSYPGPWLAATSRWYRGYYDIVLQGEWLRHLEELHEKYGEVVRIGPNELSFCTSQAYSEIYAPGSPFTKEPSLYRCFGLGDGSFAIIDPQKSKKRREMLNPLFSRRAILKLEGVIQEKVNTMISQILRHRGKPVDMSLAFRCTTFDTITDYCFAQSFDALDAEGFRHPLLVNMQASISYFWLLRYFPFILPMVLAMPQWLAERVNPLYREFTLVREQVSVQIDNFLASEASLENADHETIYHHLIKPKHDKSHHSTPSKDSLLNEALVLLQAGSDTVGHTCIVGTFYALSDKMILEKLVNELQEAWPERDTPFPFSSLEKLPYLTAFIKEALRTTHGVITPLPRVVPQETFIAGHFVPAQTVISMGSTFMHNNPRVFPQPLRFNPERWMVADTKELDTHLVTFSRGPRSCLGLSLAWCELYIVFGNLFRKLDLEMHNTTLDDFRYKEIFVPIRQGRPLHIIARERPS